MSLMKEASSLCKLGFDVDKGVGFFRHVPSPVHDGELIALRPCERLTKVSVIGAGNVGMAIAQTILTEGLADEIALVDAEADRVRGEMLDLQHAAAFLPRIRIVAGTDVLALTRSSDLAIITVPRETAAASRMDQLRRNVALLREVMPTVAEGSPESLLLVVSNPVDVLAYAAWKLSGFPSSRVIGSGTDLDSARLRCLLAEHLGVGAQDMQAYMVSEHGDGALALWSSVRVGGMPVLSYLQKTHSLFDAVGCASEVIGLKGYTSWAIGYSAASLARSLLRDQRRVHPVSVLAKGFVPGDTHEVFLSLPARLGRRGVLRIVGIAAELELTGDEETMLHRSAETLWGYRQELEL
ncbi:L-lactate dehydrogenase B-like [Triticum dicoccoides]|uniref:L-lactate dehydrogenase B-like n=1 Tax=Triticum dicoccoides TaxID=85692 RepID=UPI001891CA4E|nr:L-lactate dehydrogenase B-like [Triticum dicoccoides]